MSAGIHRDVDGDTYSDVIDPDEISSGKGESISTPDVLVVQVTDLNVLDNDVLAGKGESLSLDNALVSNTQNGLV